MNKSRLNKIEADLKAEHRQRWEALEGLLQVSEGWPGEHTPTLEAFQALRQQASLEAVGDARQDLQALLGAFPWGEYLEWDKALSQVLKAYEAGSLDAWPDDIPTPPQEREGVREALQALRPVSAKGQIALLIAKALLSIAQAVRSYQKGESPPDYIITFDKRIIARGPDGELVEVDRIIKTVPLNRLKN